MSDLCVESFNLNRFVVDKVKPEQGCICHRHNHNDDFSICLECAFLSESKNFCEYEEAEIETAIGYHIVGERSHRDWKYIHWCCPVCSELVKIDNYCSWADEEFFSKTHICNNCKTSQVILKQSVDINGRRIDGKYIVAIPVGIKNAT